MKDFRKKGLYNKEIGIFDAFKDRKLQTKADYDKIGVHLIGDEEPDEIQNIVSGGDLWGDMDSSSGWGGASDSFGGDFGSMFGGSSNDSDDAEHLQDLLREYEGLSGGMGGQSSEILQLTNALQLGMKFTFKGVLHKGIKTKKGWEPIFKNWTYISLGLGGMALLGSFGLVTNIVHPAIGFITFGSGFVVDYLNAKWNGTGLMKMFINIEEEEHTETTEGGSEASSDPFGSSSDSDFGDFGGFGGDSDFGSDFGGGSDLDFSLDDDDSDFGNSGKENGGLFGGLSSKLSSFGSFGDDVDEEEDEPDDDEEENDEIERLFPTSPISILSDAEFDETLLKVFKDGNKYKGRDLHTRAELVKSFAPYMVSNDSKFAKWKDITPKSTEYLNIAFTIYKALVDIDNKFEIKNKKDSEKLTIMSMRRTPLLYKIEIKLPAYFKANKVRLETKKFENVLKRTAEDTEVACLISSYDDLIVIKFIRFDNQGLISLGDILRYKSEDDAAKPVINSFISDKGIPILAGLRDNEFPFMFDLEGNTSGNIVGGSGSGKSWLTFLFMMNMLISNSPDDLQFVILDAKNATIWQQFAKTPHVLGYHTDIHKYKEFLAEIESERSKRQQMLADLQVEDWKTLREDLRAEQNWAELKKYPTVIVVIDEITYTMNEYANLDDKKEYYNSIKNSLGGLSAVVRSAGIRLLTIGQRSIDTSIPKTLMANASMKFGMKMNVQNDFGIMFGKEVDACKKPTEAGEGLMVVEGSSNIDYIKTLTPGGAKQQQIQKLIRVIALDWTRRTIGNGVDYSKVTSTMTDTFKECFNRDGFYKQSLRDLEKGFILNGLSVNHGYAVNIDPGKPADFNSKFGASPNDSLFDAPNERKDVTLSNFTKNNDTFNDFEDDIDSEVIEDFDFNAILGFNDEDNDDSDYNTPIEFDKFSSGFLTDTTIPSNTFGEFEEDDVVDDTFNYHEDSSGFEVTFDDNVIEETDFGIGIGIGNDNENSFVDFNGDDDSEIDFSGFNGFVEDDSEFEFSAFDELEEEEVEGPFNDFKVEIEEVDEPLNTFESVKKEYLDYDTSLFDTPIGSDGLPISKTNTHFTVPIESLDIDPDGFDFSIDYEDSDLETLTSVTVVYDEAPSTEISSLFDILKPEFEYVSDDETNRDHLRTSIAESIINNNSINHENLIDIIVDDDDDFDDMDLNVEETINQDDTNSEQESLEIEKSNLLRIEKERLETENKNRLRIEKERLEQETINRLRFEKETAERERRELEHANKMRIEKEQLEKERLAFENMKKLQLEKERLEKERLLKELEEWEIKEKALLLEKEKLEKELKEKAINNEKETLNIPNNVNQKKISVENISVDQYISKYGKSRDVYSKYCSKDEIQRKFTQRQIKLAIQNGTILEVDDAYLI